ncbi:hypothetical protein Droror1_Dr00001492 [Drosera rotundifolia]
MATASAHHRFLTNAIYPSALNLKHRIPRAVTVSCSKSAPSKDQDDNPVEQSRTKVELHHRFAKLAIVAVAAGVLSLGSVGDAYAGKSGGRVGGQAFRSSAPRASSPRINNSRTNIYVNPPVAPPLVGGYGYGYGYGGWGWSPFSFFAPGPSVAIGIGGGFDFFILCVVLGAVGAVIRRFLGSRSDEDDY